MKQHLKQCSKRRQDEILVRQPFYRKGVNLGGSGDLASEAGPAEGLPGASDAVVEPAAAESAPGGGDGAALASLLERLAVAYPRAVAEVLGASTDAEELLQRSVLAAAGNVAHAEKHEVQNAALTDLIMEWGLAGSEALVVEYGCGRAGLAASVLARRPGLRCVLVDRDARRHKMENRQAHRAEAVLRLRLDISDFDLEALVAREPLAARETLPSAADFSGEALRTASSHCNGSGHLGPAERLEELWKAAAALQVPPWPPGRLLACAKHLCGGATDIALRSLVGRGAAAAAVCIATCCHHRCDDVSYVNLPFLQGFGLCESGGEFARLASLAGWAVGGRGDVVEKRRIGMMAKRMLDLGRVAWLREALGLQDASLAEYIEKDVTPENIAIIAGGVQR